MRHVIAIFILFLAGFSAQAQQGAVSFGVGSLGATVEAGYRLGPNFGLRGIAGFAQADKRSQYNGAPLTGRATIGGVGVLTDLYFGGGGRITAGGILQNYGADLAITGNMTVNGVAFTNIDVVGRLDAVNRLAPVVAIGYEKAFGSHWGVSADLGAMYTGGFTLTAVDNSTQIPQADLDTELAATNADLGQITLLPFVKLSVSFAF